MTQPDVLVVGAGPNGLTAAAYLARAGLKVHVLEASDRLGGGLRTEELTLSRYRHDVCSAVHTMGCLSPAFRQLQLESHGLQWLYPHLSLAHPLDGGKVACLSEDIADTAEGLGVDRKAYEDLVRPFCSQPDRLFADLLSPLAWPRSPWTMARFALVGLGSARRLACQRFQAEEAKALLAGCAAHAIQPLENPLTAAFALTFLLAGHTRPWPIAAGGSETIARALVAVCKKHGVSFETGRRVLTLSELPDARAVVFNLAPQQLAEIAEDSLPSSYRRRLHRYRMGPGCFKLDWALSGPIPWTNPQCKLAATVHVGGTLNEISRAEADVWQGRHPDRPFVLVAQQSLFDPKRAPEGKQTGYAYCHVPSGSDEDCTDAIERQLERFAPGFRDLILARNKLFPSDFAHRNPSHLGGAVTGGVADIGQLFTRPTARLDPYSTPNPRLFLCSHSTPPGGGVHGMCGFYAARSVLRKHFGIRLRLPPVGSSG